MIWHFLWLKPTRDEWFVFNKLRHSKVKIRIQKSYISAALIQHGDRFCVCQLDYFSLVYGTKKNVGCLVLSGLLCEENRIWRNVELIITKKRRKQLLEVLLKHINPGVSVWSTVYRVSVSVRTVGIYTPPGSWPPTC